MNHSTSKKTLTALMAVLMVVVAFGVMVPVSAQPALDKVVTASGSLDPTQIPKWVNQLTGPPPVYVSDPLTLNKYTVKMMEFNQQILPAPLPATKTWGYGGLAKDAITGKYLGFIKNSPGPTFETKKGVPITVKWVNEITSPSLFAVDPTIHWANPKNLPTPSPPYPAFPPGDVAAQSPVPLVTHVHGLEVQSSSDGGPDQWFTADGRHGPGYRTLTPTAPNAAVYYYPNAQPPTTLFYHDHALGMTRTNLASGLAGFYLERGGPTASGSVSQSNSASVNVGGSNTGGVTITQTNTAGGDPIAPLLPSGKYEMPLAIQDRSFNADGSFFFPNEGINPDDHPYWYPEFFGDTMMVNGKVWPNMNVAQGQYRLRIVDGSNARFYTLGFSNGMSFTQIGGDGGYLRAPVQLTSLTIAPGERADLLVDFSKLAPGTKVVMTNSANAPFPMGDPAGTTSEIMQFTVTSEKGKAPASLPSILNPQLAKFPSLGTPSTQRIKTLYEVAGTNGPLMVTLDGQMWENPISEKPKLGTTEQWSIPNLTPDAHPIHIHLVQWQVVSRQKFDVDAYTAKWLEINGAPGTVPPYQSDHPTVPLDPTPYLQGSPSGPDANEQGWKDTVRMNPGEITVVKARWAPTDGSLFYPFNARIGPGYVWHCHIVDHEDNEMMRPYVVI